MHPTMLSPINRDMLQLFSNTNLVGMSTIEKIELSVEGASTINSAVDTISEAATGEKSIVTRTVDNIIEPVKGSVENIIESVKKKLIEYFNVYNAKLKDQIKQRILDMVPSLVKTVFEKLDPALEDIKQAASKIASSLSKVINNYRTRSLAENASTKVGTDVIHKIRSEIRDVAIHDAAIALVHGGVVAINLTSAGIGATVTGIVKAVVAAFNFFKGLYNKWVMEAKFLAFKEQCILLNEKKDTVGESFFRDWFRMQMQ